MKRKDYSFTLSKKRKIAALPPKSIRPSCDRMAQHLVLSRLFDNLWDSLPIRYNICRISASDGWSAVNIFPNEFPKKFNANHVTCSGNGLMCLYCSSSSCSCTAVDDGEFVIWNLSTGTCDLIPQPDSAYYPCLCPSRRCSRQSASGGTASGLGFVGDAIDYKHVRFMYYLNVGCFCGTDPSLHVAVYSSKNNSWKEVPFPFDFDEEYDISPDGAATCVNGFFYWTTCVDVILSFELSSDSFSTIPYPDGIVRDFRPGFDSYLLELDGSLGLVIVFKIGMARLLNFWVYECQGRGSSHSHSPWTRKINLDVSLDAPLIKPLWLGKTKKKNNGGENSYEYSLLLHGYDGYDATFVQDMFHPRRREALLEYDYATRELKKIDLIHGDEPCRMIISSFVETNKVNINDCGEDLISPLPDHILVSILSLLSLKDAASTSVLSTRWLDLWRHASNLNFHFADHLLPRDKHKYIECVTSVVQSSKAPTLKEVNISLPINYSTRCAVIKWLKFAFSRRVEVLELNFMGARRRFVFLERFLCILKSTNLRSLCLKCLEVNGYAIGMVLRNCPLLEQLMIKYAVLTSDVEVCGSALKHLDIQYCTGGISIKGYAPNLTHLKIDSGPFILDKFDYPKLVSTHPFISSQLTTLEFTLEGYLEKGFPEMPSLRVLIVTYHKRRHSIRPITCLICALPCLEEFEIKHCRRSCIEIEQQQQQQGVESVNNVCHHRIRVFKFTWFDVRDGDHVALMSYILENCVALQKITLDIYEADSPRTWPCCVAAMEYAKQLQSRLPTHIQLIVTFNYRQLL